MRIDTPPRRIRRHHRDDRGVVLVVFVAVLAVLMAFGALVLGGSLAYSAERNTQTAADAAAIAATAKLRQVWIGDATVDEVLTTAQEVALDNGAHTVTCEVVSAAYALDQSPSQVIGPCNGTNEWDVDAGGIRVTVSEDHDVPFGSASGTDTVTARTVAAATAQPLRNGRAPFMVCSFAEGHPVDVLVEDAGEAVPWVVNPAAIGEQYVLHGNPMKDDGRQCGGQSESWRGLVEFEALHGVPGWWGIKAGNSKGTLPTRLAGPGGCALSDDGTENVLDFAEGCRIAVPLCITSNYETGDNLELYCVRLGAFELSWIGGSSSGEAPCLPGVNKPPNNLICGEFVGGALATSGTGGTSSPINEEVVVINLVE